MADHRFDGVAPLEPAPLASLHAALAAVRQVDGSIAYPFRVSLVDLVTVSGLRVPTDQPQHLPERAFQGVPVKGIGVQRLDTDYPIAPGGGDYRYLAAELVLLVGLAFGDAFHLGSMQAVQLVFVLALLR